MKARQFSIRPLSLSLLAMAMLLATIVLPTAVLPTAARAAADASAAAKEQLAFGVKMAQRGLWQEALFRFKQADRLDPNNSRTMNNIAVCYEAMGLFEKALEVYQEAVRMDPSNENLRQNYAHFVDFYRNFRPDPGDGEAATADGASERGEGAGR